MIRTPGAITMGIIMARAIIMDIMVMKAATAITVKDMSADTTMAKGSTVAIKRETKDAVTITANKKRIFANPVYLYFRSRDCNTWFKKAQYQ